MSDLPSGTVTFLLTDVEGSTALWQEADEAMRTAAARHDALFEQAVQEHRGVHIRPRGESDSRFAVFSAAPDAVMSAIAMQHAFAAEAWPTPRPIKVRIGVHTGQAELRDGDYYGSAVNRCARLSVAQNGDLYVSDGYGNARIHRFSADGTLLQSWGEPGTGAGQFNLPHSVWAHTDGRVFVCDRENDRVQIFGPTGDLLAIWTNVTRPGDLFILPEGTIVLGEMDWLQGTPYLWGGNMPENRPAQVSIRDLEGNVLSSWGTADRCAPGSFVSPHGLWVDSKGSIYVGEVTKTSLSRFGQSPEGCHSVQKFAKV